MQTNFSPELLANSHMRASEKIVRTCVHCGFCTATCPTYLLLGDELDSPRGRIYLIKEMLENRRPATELEVKHIDRCLSCLACMTTCPSGVHYMHLVDHARAYIEATYQRPLADRMLRAALSRIIPSRDLFRAALRLAKIGRPLRPVVAPDSPIWRETRGDARAGAQFDPGANRDRRARGISRRGRPGETPTHRVADGLRPGRARA